MVTVAEFREIHSLFLAILQPQLEHPLFLPEGVMQTGTEEDSSASPQGVPENAMAWLEIVGAAISLHWLRRYAREHGIAEPASRALLRFWIAKKTHFPEDHEKVDWLATYLFKAREQESKEPTGWVKSELQLLLKGIPSSPLGPDAQSLLGELPPLLDDARYLGAFSQITDSNILERGREMKAQLGDDLFNPVALAAVVNYNLVLGRKFDELLDRAILHARDAAPSTSVHQLTEALRNDYRSNAGVIQQLADLTRKQLTEKAEVQVGSGPEPLLDQQLKRLGIDSTHEASKVRGRLRDLATKLMADPTIRSIRICGSPLSLQEWEVNAFRSLTTKREENLQGAFARSVSRAIAILVRIIEELYAYESKKGAGDASWKKHQDALFYLLYEGRGHRAALLQLSSLHRKSDLPEMAQQLVSTAEKLEANLARLDELF